MGSLGSKRLLVVGLVLLLAISFTSTFAWGGEKTLRFQVNYAGTSKGGASMRYFADQVAKESGGKLKCQLFFAGQILKTKEAFSALQKGMIDGLYSALLYYGGIVKEASWEWLPFTWQDPQQVVELYYKQGLLDVMQEALAAHGVRYLGAIPMGTLGFLTKFPVKNLADFKGKKIRASGPQASVVKLLGATPVSLAAAEQYTALQRGTIEGTIYPWYTVEAYKFYEVIDYIVTPGVYSPCVIDVMMNQKSWQRLSDAEKQAVSRAALNTVKWAAGKNLAWDQEGLAVTKKHKVQMNKLSDQELRQLRNATKPMWDKVAARSKLSGKAVQILRDYLKTE